MGGQKFFQEDEAEQILRIAASKSSLDGALSREQLMATAAELGISAEAVMEAEEQVSRQRRESALQATEQAGYARYRSRKMRDFYGQFATYCIVVALLFRVSEGESWWFWMTGLWGLAVLKDGFRAFGPSLFAGEDAFEKWKRRQNSSTSPGTNSRADEAIQEYLLSSDGTTGKLGAIKAVREATSMDLKSSKEYVENWELKNPDLWA